MVGLVECPHGEGGGVPIVERRARSTPQPLGAQGLRGESACLQYLSLLHTPIVPTGTGTLRGVLGCLEIQSVTLYESESWGSERFGLVVGGGPALGTEICAGAVRVGGLVDGERAYVQRCKVRSYFVLGGRWQNPRARRRASCYRRGMWGQQLAVVVCCVLGFGCTGAVRAGASRGCSSAARSAARSTSRSAPRVFEGAVRYELPVRRVPLPAVRGGGESLDETLRALRGSPPVSPVSTPASSSSAKRVPDLLDAAELAVEQVSGDED